MLVIKISKKISPRRWRLSFALKRNETKHKAPCEAKGFNLMLRHRIVFGSMYILRCVSGSVYSLDLTGLRTFLSLCGFHFKVFPFEKGITKKAIVLCLIQYLYFLIYPSFSLLSSSPQSFSFYTLL